MTMLSSDEPKSWDTRVRPQASSPLLENAADENQAAPVRLSPGCRLDGNLFVSGNAVIDCELKGELEVGGELLIGPDASIEGKVSAERLYVAGQVRGELIGRARLELQGGADVEGSLTSPSLVIEDGVRFVGQCAMPKRQN